MNQKFPKNLGINILLGYSFSVCYMDNPKPYRVSHHHSLSYPNPQWKCIPANLDQNTTTINLCAMNYRHPSIQAHLQKSNNLVKHTKRVDMNSFKNTGFPKHRPPSILSKPCLADIFYLPKLPFWTLQPKQTFTDPQMLQIKAYSSFLPII